MLDNDTTIIPATIFAARRLHGDQSRNFFRKRLAVPEEIPIFAVLNIQNTGG